MNNRDRVFLNIDTRYGLISIPFKGLRELDNFTIGFNNQDELINAINQILGINILVDDIWEIYIHSNRYKKKEGLNFIKYRNDDAVKNQKNVKRTNLSKLESRRDDYVQNLIELASRGEEELEMAMEELSKIDLEELKESLGMVDMGVIDGITKDVGMMVDIDDIVAFEHLTDFRDNELEIIKMSYNSSYGRKR